MVNNGYPLVNIQKAMKNGHRNLVDFPMNSMVDLSIAMLVYQRVPKISLKDMTSIGKSWIIPRNHRTAEGNI